MMDHSEPQRPAGHDTVPDSALPSVPQSESERDSQDKDFLLAERSTPELRRWLRARYKAVTGEK